MTYACVHIYAYAGEHTCVCMSKQKFSLLRQGLLLDRELADCLNYLVRKAKGPSCWQFPSAGGQVPAAMPGSLHRYAGPELWASCLCSKHCTDQVISPANKLFTFIIGCNHKILKRLLWREWIQTFRNNNIYAAYPAALVLLLLKYEITLCLQPLSHPCICAT